MTIDMFLEQCAEIWPSKELNQRQIALYQVKLSRFSDRQLSKIFEYLTENVKFFPRLPDIFEAANVCLAKKISEHKPHTWTPTECRLCGGSGQLAVFYEQLFDPENGKRELRLQRIMQYEASEPTTRTHDEWTRYYFRCSCDAGNGSTLEKGLPRWSGEKREFLQLGL